MFFQIQYDKKNKKEIKCYRIVKASDSNKAHQKEFYFKRKRPFMRIQVNLFPSSLILRNNLSKYFSKVGR